MEMSAFVCGRRPRTRKNQTEKMAEQCKDIVLHSNEDAGPLDDMKIIPVPPVKASQLFKNSCRPAVYVQKVWKMGFSRRHTKLIRRTPFGAFVDMQTFTVDGRLLADIIRCHNGGDEFIFCGKPVLFSADEVALILGLPAHGKKIDTSSQLFNGRLFRRFGQGLDLRQEGLEKLICQLRSSKAQEDIEDTVRLWIAYMLAMFLAPKSNQRCPRYLIQHLDDLSQLDSIDWASALKELIVQALPEIAACLRSEEPVQSKNAKKVRRQPTLFGCSAALVAWFLEHTSMRAPAYPDKLPRLLKWYDHQMKIQSVRVADLQPEDLMEGATVPLSQERWLLTQQTVASPQPKDSCAPQPTHSCVGCAELRTELESVKNQLDDVSHRLSIAESLLSSLLRKESNARNEEDKGDGKTEKGHSLELVLPEPGNGNSEEKRMEEDHSLDDKTETVNENKDEFKSDNNPATPPPKGVDLDIEIIGMPSLVRRVKKQPRKRKASKIVGDSYETTRPKKSAKTVDTSKPSTTVEDDQIIIKNFLSEQVTDEIVYANMFSGVVTRRNLQDLINNEMIIDDIIDAGQEFLMRNWTEQPDRYHKCIIASVFVSALCLNSSSAAHELAGTSGASIFADVSDEDKAQFRFLFTIINSNNSHWHLVVVDMERKVFMHLNSIKRNSRYQANAQKWRTILGHIFHIYCDKKEVMTWPMEDISDCPSQPTGSLDCGLYCLRYMECLARRDNPDMKMDFKNEEVRDYRRQLAATILREGLNKKISDIVEKCS